MVVFFFQISILLSFLRNTLWEGRAGCVCVCVSGLFLQEFCFLSDGGGEREGSRRAVPGGTAAGRSG